MPLNIVYTSIFITLLFSSIDTQMQHLALQTQVTRLKEQLDKGMSEKDDLSSHCLLAEESLKRAQKQQRDLADELLGSQRKETEASERSKEMVIIIIIVYLCSMAHGAMCFSAINHFLNLFC